MSYKSIDHEVKVTGNIRLMKRLLWFVNYYIQSR